MFKEVMMPGGKKKSSFMNKVMEILPDGGNLNLDTRGTIQIMLNIFILAFKYKNYTRICSCVRNSLLVDSSSVLVGWALPTKFS